jgi:hypothetical protein
MHSVRCFNVVGVFGNLAIERFAALLASIGTLLSRAFAGVEELQLFVRMPGQAFDHEAAVIFFDLFGKGSVFMLPIDDERVD